MSELTADPLNDYSWAEYLDYMEGGADVLSQPPKPPARPDHPIYGVTLALALTVAAVWICEIPIFPFTLRGGRHPIEPVMMAIVLGMIVSSFTRPKLCVAGLKFCVKKVLPLGIILLGARLSFGDVLKVGGAGIALSVMVTVISFGVLMWLSKQFRLPRKLGLLLGAGVGICGGSAIVATAPVIEAEEKDVVFALASITILGMLSMFILPPIAGFLGMNDNAFGVWAGLSIHSMPQVMAAGFAYSPAAGNMATVSKLARVCLLAPVVFVVGLLHARGEAKEKTASGKKVRYLEMFPMFVLGFLAMALAKSLGLLPSLHFASSSLVGGKDVSIADVCERISKYSVIISMAAVGLETRLSAMKQTGFKPFLASLLASIVITVVSLYLIRAIGIH